MAMFPPRRVPEPLFFRRSERPNPVAPAPPPAAAPKPALVHWRPVVVVGGLALLLVGVLIAWLATHPPRRDSGATPPAVEVPAVAIHPTPTPLAAPVVAPPRPVVSVVVAAAPVVAPPPVAVKPAAADDLTPPEEDEPEPAPEPAKETAAAPPAPDKRGETYGTRVLFLNSPAEAARTARKEEKLLFVLHVSGNFEESCFT